MPITGLRSETRLDRTRKKCVEAGWLGYSAGTKSTPGKYWTLIPEHAEQFSDTPVDDERQGVDSIHDDGSPQRFPPDSPHKSLGNPQRIRKASGENPESKHRTSIPNPVPSPCPREREERLPAKAGRSPPPLADSSPPFDELAKHWNDTLAVCHTMTDARRKKLTTRWKDATFRNRWREAIDRISQSDFCRGLNDRGRVNSEG